MNISKKKLHFIKEEDEEEKASEPAVLAKPAVDLNAPSFINEHDDLLKETEEQKRVMD